VVPNCCAKRIRIRNQPRSGDSLPAPGFRACPSNPKESVSASKFPLLDRRGRRERLFLIASGGVVDKLMYAQRSLLFRCLLYHPVCASKEGGLFLYGAATPPVQEGKFAGRHIFLRLTRTGSKAGGWQTVAATRFNSDALRAISSLYL
jgi:hypothetical protein